MTEFVLRSFNAGIKNMQICQKGMSGISLNIKIGRDIVPASLSVCADYFLALRSAASLMTTSATFFGQGI